MATCTHDARDPGEISNHHIELLGGHFCKGRFAYMRRSVLKILQLYNYLTRYTTVGLLISARWMRDRQEQVEYLIV